MAQTKLEMKFKSDMPIIKKTPKKESLKKCARCGWAQEEHRFGLYCYHYSDQDMDYFYDGNPIRLLFVPKGTKVIGENLYGKIYETDKT